MLRRARITSVTLSTMLALGAVTPPLAVEAKAGTTPPARSSKGCIPTGVGKPGAGD